jgi:hypothetical protein
VQHPTGIGGQERGRAVTSCPALGDCIFRIPLFEIEPPVKSDFEQVHLARRFGASNLVKTPLPGRLVLSYTDSRSNLHDGG